MIRLCLLLLSFACTDCTALRNLIPPEPMARVCWIGPYTHDSYCGYPIERSSAEAQWAAQENLKPNGIRHFVVPEQTSEKTDPIKYWQAGWDRLIQYSVSSSILNQNLFGDPF